MSLTSDHEVLPGKKWSRRRRAIVALMALPAMLYAPGFLLALPSGVATSFPFWAEAQDYSCSPTQVRSLMVRIAPYAQNAKASDGKGWDCERLVSYGDKDLSNAGWRFTPSDMDGQRHVRIYTPFLPARASLPTEPIPADMSQRQISLKREPAAAQPKPR